MSFLSLSYMPISPYLGPNFHQHGLEILGVKALIVIVNAKKNWFREHLNAKIYTL
jgi:hypothetical protein